MHLISRRRFLHASMASAAAVGLGTAALQATPDAPAKAPAPQDASVRILHPRGRIPLSFFIDDSTCLVNMGHFCMPQFAEAWPDRPVYKRPWKEWPREIPDAFVREFGTFCIESGVKGKYSIVPNPACVGWLDRELPGWSRRELKDSLKLVREVMVPNWDIHPEMITHTRVIDLATGRPFDEISNATMENSYPQVNKSADELAAYLAYALRILRNCELPCEGITTPGGFGNRVKSELSLAVQQAVRDVYKAEIPHYFKYVSGGKESANPKIEHLADADSDHPRLTVNIPAGTGDWFGGWEGDQEPEGHRYCNDDASAGRMVELIEKGEPAIMLCHWPGVYGNGTKKGFEQFKKIVKALHARYGDRTAWMKISEIARYWAARELTRISRQDSKVTLTAPFACPNFTLSISQPKAPAPTMTHNRQPIPLKEVPTPRDLIAGAWRKEKDQFTLCFDLMKGQTTLEC